MTVLSPRDREFRASMPRARRRLPPLCRATRLRAWPAWRDSLLRASSREPCPGGAAEREAPLGQVTGIEMVQPSSQIGQLAADEIQLHLIERARAGGGAEQDLAPAPGYASRKVQQAGDGAQVGRDVAIRNGGRRDGRERRH